MGQKSWCSMAQLVLCSESHKDKIKVSARLCSCLDTLGENTFPGSFRMLATLSSKQLQDRGPHFLAVHQAGFSLAFRGSLHSLAHGPLPKAVAAGQVLFIASESNPSDLSFFPFPLLLPSSAFFSSDFSIFKGLCDYMGPTKVISLF